MDTVKISLVTVVYNGEKTLERTIQSVCNQTLLPFEYLIIDGKSKDKTVEIAKQYEKDHPFIKVVSEADDGIYDAMNKGISMTTGTLIGLVNSDDWLEPNSLEFIGQNYLQYGEGIYYGFQRIMEGEKEVIVERGNHEFLHRKMIPHPTCFVSKSVYLSYGNFDTSFRSAADYELMLRFREHGINFYPLDNVITNFQAGGMSSSITGLLEVLSIKHKYGFISKKDYLVKKINLKITNFLKNLMSYKNY